MQQQYNQFPVIRGLVVVIMTLMFLQRDPEKIQDNSLSISSEIIERIIKIRSIKHIEEQGLLENEPTCLLFKHR